MINRLISGKPSLPRWQRAIPREVLDASSDPVTTDPKGEACHASESPKIYVMRNTPALIAVHDIYGAQFPLDIGRPRQGG